MYISENTVYTLILQRIASHTRSGGPSKLNLEHFTEALSDPTSGLTYPAFVGS